jgi:hypothetical protein
MLLALRRGGSLRISQIQLSSSLAKFCDAAPPLPAAALVSRRIGMRDANGQALSYVYYECEPGRRSAAKLLSEDEARRIAAAGIYFAIAVFI